MEAKGVFDAARRLLRVASVLVPTASGGEFDPTRPHRAHSFYPSLQVQIPACLEHAVTDRQTAGIGSGPVAGMAEANAGPGSREKETEHFLLFRGMRIAGR